MGPASTNPLKSDGFTRRDFLYSAIGGSCLAAGWFHFGPKMLRRKWQQSVFIAKAPGYQLDIASIIRRGFEELGVTANEIKGKRILLKPNLVETDAGAIHINTHPSVVYGAVQAFFGYGAKHIIVAEGPGHCRDSLLLLEESGMADMLWHERIPFVDLNYDSGYVVSNLGNYTTLKHLTFPSTLRHVDWVVSLAKMKTHHWAGITLSMKNLFGIMPGSYYGWPKNVLHYAGIESSILDIVATVQPQFAIVDGIVGMEGDGPIMGVPKPAGVLVMGRNLPAVDATCARIMGIDPHQIAYLAEAAEHLGPVYDSDISQVGESIADVHTRFQLVESIPAHRSLMHER